MAIHGNTANPVALNPSSVTPGKNPESGYQENKNEVFYEDFLVFICGVDVSRYVTSSLTYNLADRGGYGTCSFELSNVNDIFVYNHDQALNATRATLTGAGIGDPTTQALLSGLLNSNDAISQLGLSGFTTAQAAIIASKTAQNQLSPSLYRTPQTGGDWRYGETAKFQITKYKANKKINGLDKETGALRWEFNENSTCFHKHDPIRIFVHNPLMNENGDPSVPAWLPAWLGFLENRTMEDDYINGLRTIKITGYDIRYMLKKMRVKTNGMDDPTVAGSNYQVMEGQFKDLLGKGNFSNQPFSTGTFETVAETLLTGGTGLPFANSAGVGKLFVDTKSFFDPPTDASQPSFGDAFGPSVKGPNSNTPEAFKTGSALSQSQVKTLEDFYSLALYGKWELSTGSVSGRPLTYAEAQEIGQGTVHHASDGTISVFSPFAVGINFLLPKDGTGNKILADVSNNLSPHSSDRTWTTRYDILVARAQAANYQMYISPAGDFMFEFDMIDFQPADFGKFANFLVVDRHLTKSSFSDEHGDIPAGYMVTGATIKAQGVTAERFARQSVYLPLFGLRYGTVIETESYPFVFSGQVLRGMAMMSLMRKYAQANTMDVSFIHRPFLLPNKPLLHRPRTRIGTLDQIQHTMNLFGECSTHVTLSHGRLRRPDGSFTLITGGIITPTSTRRVLPAAELFGNRKTGVRTDLDIGTQFQGIDAQIDGSKVTNPRNKKTIRSL